MNTSSPSNVKLQTFAREIHQQLETIAARKNSPSTSIYRDDGRVDDGVPSPAADDGAYADDAGAGRHPHPQRVQQRRRSSISFPPNVNMLRAAPHCFARAIRPEKERRPTSHGSDVEGKDSDARGATAAEAKTKVDDGSTSEAYRCKCSFQILSWLSLPKISSRDDVTSPLAVGIGSNGHDCNETSHISDDPDDGDDLTYVVREGGGRIVPLPGGIFPPANDRIRRAMVDLISCLNERVFIVGDGKAKAGYDRNMGDGAYRYRLLRRNLTSATFVSSWGDHRLSGGGCRSADSDLRVGGDCLVTLHYGPPGLPKPDLDGEEDGGGDLLEWRKEADWACDRCDATLIIGRSRGRKVAAAGTRRDRQTYYEIIHDDLWLSLRRVGSDPATVEIESVSLTPPPLPLPNSSKEVSATDVDDDGCDRQRREVVRIRYRKPASAFQHPNPSVMVSSLLWILNRLSLVVVRETSAQDPRGRRRRPRLLEMYCGCGAHTIPLAKSGLLSDIVAVELDDRLVDACRTNCALNGFCSATVDNDGEHLDVVGNGEAYAKTRVEVVGGDASRFASRCLRRIAAEDRVGASSEAMPVDGACDFDVLLVDPPRDGLDGAVREMVLAGNFHDMIYVSCGRRALLRDLEILCLGGFNVASIAAIDLFPGTDAVESLVHLVR